MTKRQAHLIIMLLVGILAVQITSTIFLLHGQERARRAAESAEVSALDLQSQKEK